MQINRLFEIVYLLMDKRSMTARQLAEHFEVSPRTILRDIEVLSQAKIPVYTTRGKGGGIALLEGYVLNKATLSEEERQQILLSLQSLPATGHLNTDPILKKLDSLFSSEGIDWIEVDFSRWGQKSEDARKFKLLKESILKQTTIGFAYANSEGHESKREVYPLKLLFKSRGWYLQGFCLAKHDYRTFKLNRMFDLYQSDKSFERTKFSPPPVENSSPSGDKPLLIELEFAPGAAHWAYDEFDKECIERLADGSLHVLTRIPETAWLYRFLMSFGNEVKVLRPEHLKEILFKKQIKQESEQNNNTF